MSSSLTTRQEFANCPVSATKADGSAGDLPAPLTVEFDATVVSAVVNADGTVTVGAVDVGTSSVTLVSGDLRSNTETVDVTADPRDNVATSLAFSFPSPTDKA